MWRWVVGRFLSLEGKANCILAPPDIDGHKSEGLLVPQLQRRFDPLFI